ncbi:MAG: NAD(P)-binding protein [Desulfovibrio sp.]|nr:NAD(P)-binding protein [Desulfovibrio sp.]
MKFLILGAGPAGLTFANQLKKKGIKNFLVLEKEQEAGGLCRSSFVDGAWLDTGGGHFLDVASNRAKDFIFEFMPREEWNEYTRNSTIHLSGQELGHPFESHLWQFPLNEQVEYLKSIASAGCNLKKRMPKKFVEWIRWKLGEKIANDYMLPYNRKIFGDDLDQLGTYWLEKLPNVSFDEVLLSCLEKKPYGKEPAHTRFYYPKNYGYGEVFKRMAENIKNNILYDEEVKTLDLHERKVRTKNHKEYTADAIITTIPWHGFQDIVGLPQRMKKSLSSLKHSSVEIKYMPGKINTDAHWIYFPEDKFSYHRILVRHNFIGEGAGGYWLETNSTRTDTTIKSEYIYHNAYAYPLNTINKPRVMENLLSVLQKYSIYGLGRWGEHQHYNSDRAIEKALDLFGTLVNEEY